MIQTDEDMTRPESDVDWKRVDELLESACSGREIAGRLGMHEDTLYRRTLQKFNVGFAAYSQQKRASGDALLREAQFKKAIAGDNSMLIWLGKIRLGQYEQDPAVTSKQQPIIVNINGKLASGVDVSAEKLPTEDNTGTQ